MRGKAHVQYLYPTSIEFLSVMFHDQCSPRGSSASIDYLDNHRIHDLDK